MQFRERRRVVQVIRTTYDKKVKRGRSEVLGKIDKVTPKITERLRSVCTSDELAEVERWLTAHQEALREQAIRSGTAGLPDQMRAAAQYFRGKPDDDARLYAAEIRAAWDELKDALRKAGFSRSKLARVRLPVHAPKRNGKEDHGGDAET